MSTLFYILLFLIALFIIFLVLIQKGKGGGLAGAFGGTGGQSVFGSKAGDLFTKITIIAALSWILICIVAIRVLADKPSNTLGDGEATATAPVMPGTDANGLGDLDGALPTGAAPSSSTTGTSTTGTSTTVPVGAPTNGADAADATAAGATVTN